MEILISANQWIIAMTQNSEIKLSENMSEEEYMQWFQVLRAKEGEDENGLQKISV